MDLEAIKETTLNYFKAYYEEHGKPPSVRLAWTEVEGLTKRNFYAIFKGGQAEACTLSRIPVPEDRIKTTSKAREEKKSQKTPEKLEEELAADEEEAKLEEAKRREAAEERAIKARNELIEIEAKQDPKKTILYLRILEPEIVAPFFDLCKEAKLDPQRTWGEAVKIRGESWEEWSRALKADGEEPRFKAYVADVIEVYVPKKRLELALGHHRGETYSCTCGKCSLKYEYEDKGDYTLFTCPNGCTQDHGGVNSIYPCPVCKELGRAVNLFYDRSRNVLHCKTCSFEGEVKGPPLNSVGTEAGAFKPQIAELEEKVKGLQGKLSETQRQINAGVKEEKALEWSIREKEQACEKLNETIATLSAESEKNRQECEAELRRAEKLKSENKHVEERRVVFNAVAEFFMDPEIITGDQLAKVVKTLSVALEIRGQQGHVGESMKMTVDTRDWLVEKLAGGRYTLLPEADKRREEQLARQRSEYEVQLKLKEHRIAEERRLRETAEREQKTQASQRDEDIEKLKRENRQLRDRIRKLEQGLVDKGHREQLQMLETPSDMVHGEHPQRLGTPSSTSHLKLIKGGTP